MVKLTPEAAAVPPIHRFPSLILQPLKPEFNAQGTCQFDVLDGVYRFHVRWQKDGTIVALSALLTTTMTMMKTVIQALEKAGVRTKTRVMIGGAPITQQFADEIGADGYSDNASGAVATARLLVK